MRPVLVAPAALLVALAAHAGSSFPAPATEGPVPYDLAGDVACPPCGGGPGEVKATASTSLRGNYGPDLSLDGDRTTAWCEGDSGLGEGSWLELTWSVPHVVAGIEFMGGYAKRWDLLEANGRIKQVTFFADGQQVGTRSFADPLASKPEGADPKGAVSIWAALTGPGTGDVPLTTLRMRIDEVYPGSKYKDTCVSEWTVHAFDPAAEE